MTRKPKNVTPAAVTQPMPNGQMPYQPGPGIGPVNLARTAPPPKAPVPSITKVKAPAPPKFKAPTKSKR